MLSKKNCFRNFKNIKTNQLINRKLCFKKIKTLKKKINNKDIFNKKQTNVIMKFKRLTKTLVICKNR